MPRAVRMALAVALAAAGTAAAATVQGSLTYDGLPVGDTFADLTGGTAYTYDYDTGARVNGSVDLATGTFLVTGVDPGDNLAVWVELDRSSPPNGGGWDPGDLQGYRLIRVETADATVEVDVAMRVVVHFTSPFDSDALQGVAGASCPVGASYASPTTVRWDPVPRATTYQVTVKRTACDGTVLRQERAVLTSTETLLDWDVAGEDYLDVWVDCTGPGRTNLCWMPYVQYTDGSLQAYRFRGGGTPERGPHHADGRFVPAVASAPGVPPTYWSSSLVLLNPGETEVTAQLFFTPREVDGLENYDVATVALPGHTAVSWADVLQEVFGRSGAGSLEVRAPGVLVASRTATPAAGGGSYGQGIPALTVEDALSVGGTPAALAAGVTENAAFRTNLGLCEVWGEPATVTVTVHDASMTVLGTTTVELEPYGTVQLNRVAREAGVSGDLSGGVVRVEVTAGPGRVVAYLSVVDNATGDPTTILLEPAPAP